jgi:hypothetical protein
MHLFLLAASLNFHAFARPISATSADTTFAVPFTLINEALLRHDPVDDRLMVSFPSIGRDTVYMFLQPMPEPQRWARWEPCLSEMP